MDFSVLPPAPPDADATDRIRRRCHQELTNHRRHTVHRDGWLFVAAGAYLIAALVQALAFLK